MSEKKEVKILDTGFFETMPKNEKELVFRVTTHTNGKEENIKKLPFMERRRIACMLFQNAVEKNVTKAGISYKYCKLSDLINPFKIVLGIFGVDFTQRTCLQGNKWGVETTCFDMLNDYQRILDPSFWALGKVASIPEAIQVDFYKNAKGETRRENTRIQRTGALLTYARRYSLTTHFDLFPEEDKDGASRPRRAKKKEETETFKPPEEK